jgi:hypothetical protein
MKKLALALALTVGVGSIQAVPLLHKHHKSAKKHAKAPKKK